MKFKPNGSWVVLPDPTITETESGIILDVSKNHWKSNGKIDQTTPETSFTGAYNTVRVGFNF